MTGSVQALVLSSDFATSGSSPASISACTGLCFGTWGPSARAPVPGSEATMPHGGVSDPKGTHGPKWLPWQYGVQKEKWKWSP